MCWHIYEQIWLMTLNINTAIDEVFPGSFFFFHFFFFSLLSLCRFASFRSSDIRAYFISHFILMWFEILDLVILLFQYSLFFYTDSVRMQKKMFKPQKVKRQQKNRKERERECSQSQKWKETQTKPFTHFYFVPVYFVVGISNKIVWYVSVFISFSFPLTSDSVDRIISSFHSHYSKVKCR